MIVPTDRFLAWVAVLLPVAAIGALVPAATGIAVAISLALACTVLADAAASKRSLAGIRINLPKVARLRRGEPGSIAVQLFSSTHCPDLRLGLEMPAELLSEQEIMCVALPIGENGGQLEWKCSSDMRGSYNLRRAFVDTLSRLGFWRVRKQIDCNGEIRVYPSLLGARRQLASVFLNRGLPGIHAQRQLGQGRDFEKLRDYLPGDSYDDIHWKATAKRGHPVTKLFQLERTQEIYAIVDASRMSTWCLDHEAPIEQFVTSSLILGLAAERQGDCFGLVAFDQCVRRFVRAGGGKSHFNMCREALYNLHGSQVTPSFDELFTFIRTRLRRRSLLLILTDLGDPMLAEQFTRSIDLVCRQHMVLVLMPRREAWSRSTQPTPLPILMHSIQSWVAI